ncbi:MAG: hypothetical protein AAFR67_07700 [Chloroflexota bacterium]
MHEETSAQETPTEMTHDLQQIASPHFTFTKRQLGIGLILVGVLGFVGIFALDFVRGTTDGQFGPAQTAALIGMAGIAIIGLTLIPLGDHPA